MKKIVAWMIFILIIIGIPVRLYWDNFTVGVTRYTVADSGIPAAFDGYKIILLADIQGSEFGEKNQELIEKIEAEQGDMVVFAGDLIDTGIPGSVEVIENLFENCDLPDAVYAVSGNHDKWSGQFETLKEKWEDTYPITFLENRSVMVERDGDAVALYGIGDPDTWDNTEAEQYVKKALSELERRDGYQILLFHRANMLDLFNNETFDLVLSGHMHGGQVRLPFLGGLKSPHGDWFPAYSGGKYLVNGHTYIVSRGIGNAVQVPRIWNRGEIVVITLKRNGVK